MLLTSCDMAFIFKFNNGFSAVWLLEYYLWGKVSIPGSKSKFQTTKLRFETLRTLKSVARNTANVKENSIYSLIKDGFLQWLARTNVEQSTRTNSYSIHLLTIHNTKESAINAFFFQRRNVYYLIRSNLQKSEHSFQQRIHRSQRKNIFLQTRLYFRRILFSHPRKHATCIIAYVTLCR